MRRKRLPGTRKPRNRPLSKQRMMVCCDTLQISAASPVVNTVFIASGPFAHGFGWRKRPRRACIEPAGAASLHLLIQISHLTIGVHALQLENLGEWRGVCHVR